MVRSFVGTLAAVAVIVVVDRGGVGWGILAGVSGLAGAWLIDLVNDRALVEKDDRRISDRRAWRTGVNLH